MSQMFHLPEVWEGRGGGLRPSKIEKIPGALVLKDSYTATSNRHEHERRLIYYLDTCVNFERRNSQYLVSSARERSGSIRLQKQTQHGVRTLQTLVRRTGGLRKHNTSETQQGPYSTTTLQTLVRVFDQCYSKAAPREARAHDVRFEC